VRNFTLDAQSVGGCSIEGNGRLKLEGLGERRGDHDWPRDPKRVGDGIDRFKRRDPASLHRM